MNVYKDIFVCTIHYSQAQSEESREDEIIIHFLGGCLHVNQLVGQTF